jgi:DNA topoisomerase-1
MEEREYFCPSCGSPLVLRRSASRGEFWGCSAYPRCRVALAQGPDGAPLPPPDTGVKCGDCGAPAVVRQGTHGPFLGCSTYPRCRWTGALGSDS